MRVMSPASAAASTWFSAAMLSESGSLFEELVDLRLWHAVTLSSKYNEVRRIMINFASFIRKV